MDRTHLKSVLTKYRMTDVLPVMNSLPDLKQGQPVSPSSSPAVLDIYLAVGKQTARVLLCLFSACCVNLNVQAW